MHEDHWKGLDLRTPLRKAWTRRLAVLAGSSGETTSPSSNQVVQQPGPPIYSRPSIRSCRKQMSQQAPDFA